MKAGKILSGVSGYFCASHRCPETSVLHGHTWNVLVKFNFQEGFDAARAKRNLDAFLSEWDHSILPDGLASGEKIAEAIGTTLPDCVEVEISRSSEGIYAWWCK